MTTQAALQTSHPGIEPKTFWKAIGVRAIGGAVVAAQGKDGPAGFLGLSVTHLAQDPPTLMVSIGTKTSALPTILEARHFSVSYLSSEDKDVADIFGGKSDLKGADRFAAGRWTSLTTGAPILQSAVGCLDCEVVETIERFDTVIAIGLIVGATANPDKDPLVYFSGATGTFGR